MVMADCTVHALKFVQSAVKRKSAGLRAVGSLLQLLGDVLTLSADRPAFGLASLFEPLAFAMTQNDVMLKLAAFKLVQQVLATPAAEVSDTALDGVMTIVLKAAGDRWCVCQPACPTELFVSVARPRCLRWLAMHMGLSHHVHSLPN